jgi:hypothetical protein
MMYKEMSEEEIAELFVAPRLPHVWQWNMKVMQRSYNEITC